MPPVGEWKSYAKGGKVKKTGPAIVHKGETILPADNPEKSAKLASEHLGEGTMPQGQDPVQKALDESKKVLKGADKLQREAGGPLPKDKPKAGGGEKAPAPPKKPASEGILGDTASAAAGIKAKAENIKQYNEAAKASGGQELKPYKEGGKVEKTGPAKLHKGETVLPAKNKEKSEKLAVEHVQKKAGVMHNAVKEMEEEKPETPEVKKAEGKKDDEKKDTKKNWKMDHGETTVRHHKNGTHTVKHTRHRASGMDVKPHEDGDEHEYAVQNMQELQEALERHVGAPDGGAPEPGGPAAAASAPGPQAQASGLQ
jgi:hypothetical protein